MANHALEAGQRRRNQLAFEDAGGAHGAWPTLRAAAHGVRWSQLSRGQETPKSARRSPLDRAVQWTGRSAGRRANQGAQIVTVFLETERTKPIRARWPKLRNTLRQFSLESGSCQKWNLTTWTDMRERRGGRMVHRAPGTGHGERLSSPGESAYEAGTLIAARFRRGESQWLIGVHRKAREIRGHRIAGFRWPLIGGRTRGPGSKSPAPLPTLVQWWRHARESGKSAHGFSLFLTLDASAGYLRGYRMSFRINRMGL